MNTLNSKLQATYLLPLFLAIALVLLFADPSRGQEQTERIPENAEPKRFGSGWDCLSGFRKQENECVAIQVPENAFLS